MSDVEMQQDAPNQPPVHERSEQDRLKIQGDMQNATFSFYDEDHTLGNLLRNQIVKNKHVEFCAYSVPHPSEPICNVRIQCAETSDANKRFGTDSNTALRHGLKRISKICDVLDEKFEASLEEFRQAAKK